MFFNRIEHDKAAKLFDENPQLGGWLNEAFASAAANWAANETEAENNLRRRVEAYLDQHPVIKAALNAQPGSTHEDHIEAVMHVVADGLLRDIDLPF